MDPVVGGLTQEKIALRRAMAMSYPVDEEIKVIRNGQAIEAQFPVPPGVVGSDPGVAVERPVRSRRGQRAARQVRLQEGRGWLAHAPGRQAARHALRVAAGLARAPAGRAVEKGARLGRHPDGSAQGQVRRAPEAGEAVQAADAHGVLDRRLPGRRQLHAAPLQQEYLPEQQRLRDDPRIRPALRASRSGSPLARSATGSTARWRGSSRYTPHGASDISRYRNMLVQPRVLGYKKHPILHAEFQFIDVPAAK